MERARVEHIEELLRQYRNRGEMTRKEFCASRGMSTSAFDYYVRRYGRPSPSAARKLVKVEIEPAAMAVAKAEQPQSGGTSFTLVLRNGRRIESSWEFTDGELARLIRVVEGA